MAGVHHLEALGLAGVADLEEVAEVAIQALAPWVGEAGLVAGGTRRACRRTPLFVEARWPVEFGAQLPVLDAEVAP